MVNSLKLTLSSPLRWFLVVFLYTRVKTPKDNAVDERFNRTVTVQEESLIQANQRLTEWLLFYNFERPYQTLKYKTPIEWYNSYQLKEVSPMYPSIT